MLFFPQIGDGALVQFPFMKMQIRRTILNELGGGAVWRFGDRKADATEWELRFAALGDSELQSLKTFFEQCEGRLWSFTFLDPMANLLSFSEDLTAAAWSSDPMLQVNGAQADPWGGATASGLVNSGQTAQRLWQILGVPAGYRYCFSAYARSTQPVSLKLYQAAATVTVETDTQLTSEWRRVSSSGRLAASGDTVEFGVEVPGSGQVEVAGLQVEAQAAPSPYRRTAGAGGVYQNARFAHDELNITSEGPGSHHVALRIRGTRVS